MYKRQFLSLGDTYFARDEKRIYAYGKQLPKAELTSWELLGHWYSRDAKRVYSLNREIKGADRASLDVYKRQPADLKKLHSMKREISAGICVRRK